MRRPKLRQDYHGTPAHRLLAVSSISVPGSGASVSDAEPHRAFIQDKLEQGLSAVRIPRI